MSSDGGTSAHMSTMNKAPNTFAPSDIDLTAPLQDGLKAFLTSTGSLKEGEWEQMPSHVKEVPGNRFLPFLWNALPAILGQVNNRIAELDASRPETLNVPDSLEGLL